jgi:hypothetical protein
MVENVAMPQCDFQESGHSSLRTRILRAGDESLRAAPLWLTGHSSRLSCLPPCNLIDLGVKVR